jgi:hypothetical protein
MMTGMSYHADTFKLLGVDRPQACGAHQAVDIAELRLGCKLPSSVQEWYSRAGAIQVLNEYSNCDRAVPLEDFRIVAWNSHLLIPIKHENQGVCQWAVALDGTSDPPVYVDLSEFGRTWELHAPTFSRFVYAAIWDQIAVLRRRVGVQAQNSPLSGNALRDLTRIVGVEQETFGWPGNVQYRFRLGGGALLIWAGDDQADWFIGADDEFELRCSLVPLWDLDSVGPNLYAMTDAGKRVLAGLKKR